ncbi:MAG: hypothetical protein AAF740_04990 [Bacteroidota bacterium]
MTPSKPFTNLQLELLQLFARDLPEQNLLELKQLIAQYLFLEMRKKADAIWEEKGYSEETVNYWLDED